MSDVGSWTIDTLPVDFGLHGVWVGDDGEAIVAGSFVLMRKLGRGPWERVTVRGKLQHMAIAGTGSLRIAVGYPHSCVVSNDGGARWHNRRVGGKRKLSSITCVTERHLLVAGEDGAYVSHDAGKTFAPAGDMCQVALAELGLFGVSSDWNQVLHRWDDAGASWRAVAVMPERSNVLVAAGDVLISIGSSVHRSVDGGASWTNTLPHRDNVYLIDVAANMTGRVVVVGYAGLISVSEDFGVTWKEHRPTERNLRGVWIAPDEEIWAVGDDGVLVRSGSERAGEVAIETVNLGVADDGPSVGTVLRASTPAPVWRAAEPLGAPIHAAAVSAAVFLDDAHAVTGDVEGRLVRMSRGADRHWRFEIHELGGAITGLAAIGEAVFAIVDGRLASIDADGTRPITTPGKVTRIAGRANRLAASGPRYVATWSVAAGGTPGPATAIDVTGEPADLDISPDGMHVVFVIGDRVFSRDIASGRPIGEFRRKGAPRVRFTPGGKQLYLASDHYDIAVVSVAKGGGRDKLHTGNREWKLATSSQGATFAALSHSDELTVIDAATEAIVTRWRAADQVTLCGVPRAGGLAREPRLAPLAIPHVAITALAVSDGGSVVAGDLAGEVAIFDAYRAEQLHAQLPRAARLQIALDPPLIDVGVLAYGRDDDRGLVVLGADHRLRIIDPDSGEVRAGPRIDIANVESMRAIDEVVIVATSEGWVGVDRRTGARRWNTSFAVRNAVAYRGALYGFEQRSSYAVGQRPDHRLYRLDSMTGVVDEVPLAAPPGAARSGGYSFQLTATAAGLVAQFADGEAERWVLIDPAGGSTVETPRNTEPRISDPSKRYLVSSAGELVDIGDPAWPIIAHDLPTHGALVLADAGVIVSIVTNHLRFHAFDGALVASIGGLGGVGTTSLYATTRAEAIVTCSSGGGVRRWPVPRPPAAPARR